MRSRRALQNALLLLGLLTFPRLAHAQTIAGTVRDASGGVLPGVSVEAASPVLIEKVRTGVTDGTGQFRSLQEAIAAVLGPGFELLADLEVAYRCGCSLERARAAVSALGYQGLEDVLANEREAVITCEFCRQRYVVEEAELRRMAEQLRARDG